MSNRSLTNSTVATLTFDAHLALVTITRPESRNSLSSEAIIELTRLFELLSTESKARCVILSGSGTESFCAGADLAELQTKTDPSSRRVFFNSIATLIEAIKKCPIPVVSAVHGFALAGGMGLIGASDLVLAADDAVFGLPEVAIGLAPMVVLSPLSQVVSNRVLTRMALTGERISATEALTAGLVTQIVPKVTLNQVATDLGKTIAKQAPEAVRATKLALRQARLTSIQELADQSALISVGSEATEGITAFFEKRQPHWR